MRTTVLFGSGDVRVVDVDTPRIQYATDAIVRVTRASICGSDLWAYRGVAERASGTAIGHEFVGIVEEVGSRVPDLRPGAAVVSPFSWSDGACVHCRAGWTSSCVNRGFWGRTPGAGGAQSEYIRVPFASTTLVKVDDRDVLTDRALAVLAAGDVLATGYHAARSAGVVAGSTVCVVGDGAVGLCAVLAARHLDAAEVVVVGRHPERAGAAAELGSSAFVVDGEAGSAETLEELTHGLRFDHVLECVGTREAIAAAVSLARDGGSVGYVGVPHGVKEAPISQMFGRNVGLRGGITPARHYLPFLLSSMCDGRLDASSVFDAELPLSAAPDGYSLMDQRRAIKVALVP